MSISPSVFCNAARLRAAALRSTEAAFSALPPASPPTLGRVVRVAEMVFASWLLIRLGVIFTGLSVCAACLLLSYGLLNGTLSGIFRARYTWTTGLHHYAHGIVVDYCTCDNLSRTGSNLNHSAGSTIFKCHAFSGCNKAHTTGFRTHWLAFHDGVGVTQGTGAQCRAFRHALRDDIPHGQRCVCDDATRQAQQVSLTGGEVVH